MPSSPLDVVVFRTGLLHEADLVSQALEQAGVPNFQRSEVAGGPEFAMRPSPVPGPGTLFVVKTETALAKRALQVIQTLPVSHDNASGPWAFHPKPAAKPLFQAVAAVVATILLIGLIYQIISLVRQMVR